ncbi:hypothetical protein F4804DRAFT_331115 [Jackrogersella minutella]|nr:hypothetical protein F4804DRAFT_331115 [Jackrogersella minutella]
MPRYASSPSSAPHAHASSRSHRSSLSADSEQSRQHWPSSTDSDKGKDVLKTSLVFLGVVGAASVAAAKYWPKGILYGKKESWAQEAKEAKEEAKHIMNGDAGEPLVSK